MKIFNGPRPIEQITENLKKYRFHLDKTHYNQGSDYLDYYAGEIEGQMIMLLMVCPWDGRFIACDFDKNLLGSERSDLDGTPWYDALLDEIYEPIPENVAAIYKPAVEDRSAAKQGVLEGHLSITTLAEAL